MAKRTIHAPRQFDSGSWIVARYDDTKQLSEVFAAEAIETLDGKTGVDIMFKIGDDCLAPWKRAGKFPGIVAVVEDDKTICLKKKQTLEANEQYHMLFGFWSDICGYITCEDFISPEPLGKGDILSRQGPWTPTSAITGFQCTCEEDVVPVKKKTSKSTVGKEKNTASVPTGQSKQAIVLQKKMEKQGKIMAASHAARSILKGIQMEHHVHENVCFDNQPSSSGVGSFPTSQDNTEPCTLASPHKISESDTFEPTPQISSKLPTTQNNTYLFTTQPSSSTTKQSFVLPVNDSMQSAISLPIPSKDSSGNLLSSQSCMQLSTPNYQQSASLTPIPCMSTASSLPQPVSASFHSYTPTNTGLFNYSSFLTEDCPNCLNLTNQITNLTGQIACMQEQLNLLCEDNSNLKEKYQKAINDNSQLQLKVNTSCMPAAESNNCRYTPNKGLKIPKADYIVQQNLCVNEIPPGYCQFGGPGSNVMVTLKWKKTMEAKTKKAKPTHAMKKYIDGFFNPWDIQGITSASLDKMTGDKKEIFEALELFATNEFGFSTTQFNRIINTKAGSCRRTINTNFPEYALPKGKRFKKSSTNESDI